MAEKLEKATIRFTENRMAGYSERDNSDGKGIWVNISGARHSIKDR